MTFLRGATLGVLLVVALVFSGCLLSGIDSVKRTPTPGEAADSERGSVESGLVDSSSRVEAKPDATRGDRKKDELEPAKAADPARVEGQTSKSLTPEERIEQESLRLAKEHGPLDSAQLCYIKKDQEWWLVLYKDIGSAIDIKRWYWNWEKEEFAPFLVLDRIPRSKMEEQLTKKERGRTCRTLPLPPAPAPTNPDKPAEAPDRPAK